MFARRIHNSLLSRIHVWGLAFTMMLVAGIPPAAAAQAPIRVQGVVLAPTGEPVTAARIEVDGMDGQKPVTTDEKGHFRLSLSPGEWELSVSHPSYRKDRTLYPGPSGSGS